MHPSLAHRALGFLAGGSAYLLFLPAFSQSTSGRIVGRVADPTGAVLAGVKITLVNEATGASRDTQSNESGDFKFVEVVPGSYRVEFELAGFKKNVQNWRDSSTSTRWSRLTRYCKWARHRKLWKLRRRLPRLTRPARNWEPSSTTAR